MKRFWWFFNALIFLIAAPAACWAADLSVQSLEVYQTRTGTDGNSQQCNFVNGCSVAGTDVTIKASGLYRSKKEISEGTPVSFHFVGKGTGCPNKDITSTYQNGTAQVTVPGNNVQTSCLYWFRLEATVTSGFLFSDKYTATSKVQETCDHCNENIGTDSTYELCTQIDVNTEAYLKCIECLGPDNDGIWTAIGCIPTNPESIIQVVIQLGLTIGGAIVLIMILVGSFMLSVSQGDPNKTKEAKEMITSAIIGLLFVIFSITILQFIGVNILHIPGFGGE